MDLGVFVALGAVAVLVFFFGMMFLISMKIIRAPWFEKLCNGLVKVVGTLFAVYAVFVFAILFYKDWIPITRDVLVSVDTRNWIPEEVKICASTVSKAQRELVALACLDGNGRETAQTHILKVKFWGSIQADRDKVWKCTRGQEFLTCKLQ